MLKFQTAPRVVPTSPWSSAKIIVLTVSLGRGRSTERAHCGAYMSLDHAQEAAQKILDRFTRMTDRRSIIPAISPSWRDEESEQEQPQARSA